VRLHGHSWGDPTAPPLVCLHGVTGHGLRFRKLAEERLARRFRVLAFDLRGHGRSSWNPPWNIPTHVEDILETLAAEGVERATWIGHSFGGRLVLELTARAPDRVGRAVLLDPAIQAPPEGALDVAEKERQDRVFATVDDAIAARIADGSLVSTPREILEEEMREHLVRGEDGRLRYRYCQSVVIAAYGELAAPPASLDGHIVPTLLVVANESRLVHPAQVEQYQAALGDRLRVVRVPGGHSVLWDAFDETADAIDAFLT
jgi:lipase